MESILPEKEAYAIGIVGATGLVGQTIAEDLVRRDFPVDYGRSKLFASAESKGMTKTWGDRVHILQHQETVEDYESLDIVFLSAGGDAAKTKVSKEECPKVAEAGAIAIDNSSAWRQDPDVPLVVAEVNPGALAHIPKGIISNPNCTTMEAMTVLKPLHDAAGLLKIVMSSYQAVSGQGYEGVEELLDQSKEMAPQAPTIVQRGLRPGDPRYPAPETFQYPVAYNVTPQAGTFVGRDTTEELKFKNEGRKILGLGNLAIDATCVRVPVLNGHSMMLDVELERPLSPEEAETVLQEAPGVLRELVPQPLDASGRDDVLAGRVRASEVFYNGINLFISGDNLQKGAALNAVQIAELLIGK